MITSLRLPCCRRSWQPAAMSDQKIVQPRSGNAIVDLDIRLSSALYRDLGLKVPRPVFKLLENTGSGLLWLPLAPALLLAPSAPPALHTCAANLLLGLLVDIAFVGTLKGVFRRPRPSYNDAGDFLLVVAVDSYSFPSGHAARCCSTHIHHISVYRARISSWSSCLSWPIPSFWQTA